MKKMKLLLLSFLELSRYISFFKKNLIRNTIYIILIGIILINFSNHRWVKEKSVIQWDIISYYGYLPATFIYKDLSLKFRNDNIKKFGDLVAVDDISFNVEHPLVNIKLSLQW